MNILFVGLTFIGHLKYLYEYAEDFSALPQHNVTFLVDGWANSDIPKLHGNLNYHFLQSEVDLALVDPTKFNLERATHIREKLERFYDLRGPFDAIVYDFFAFEAKLLGMRRRIPTYCSVPAILPFHDRSKMLLDVQERYANSIDAMASAWGVDKSELKFRMVSDSIYLQGDKTYNWLPPSLFAKHLPPSESVDFLSPMKMPADDVLVRDNSIYVCLGTVVNGNLRNQNPLGWSFAKKLYRYFLEAAAATPNHPWTIVVPSDAALQELREELKPLLAKAPNAQLIGEVKDPADRIAKAKMVIYHGGGNTFAEAFWSTTPMIVIPFFGDQNDSAEWVRANGMGVAFTYDDPVASIVTPAESFDRKSLKDSSDLLDAVQQVLKDEKEIRQRMSKIAFVQLDEPAILPVGGQVAPLYRAGDLVFGVNADRIQFVKEVGWGEKVRLGIYKAFHTYEDVSAGAMPGIIDQYHDTILALRHDPSTPPVPQGTPFAATLARYTEYLERLSVPLPEKTDSEEQAMFKLWVMCEHGLDFFLYMTDFDIHFALNIFKMGVNKATTMEIVKLKQLAATDPHVLRRVHNYRFINGLWKRTKLVESMPPQTLPSRNKAQRVFDSINASLEEYRIKAKIRAPFLTEARLKSVYKGADPEHPIQLPSEKVDILGFRVIFLWTKPLFELGLQFTRVARPMHVDAIAVYERGRVVYHYGHVDVLEGSTWLSLPVELQLWPSALYTVFEYEHDLIYKPRRPLTKEDLERSALLREEEHRLQDFLDENFLLQ